MTMKFSTLIKQLMGFIVLVTDHKYSIVVLRNDLLCDGVEFVPTCPVFAGPVTTLGSSDVQDCNISTSIYKFREKIV